MAMQSRFVGLAGPMNRSRRYNDSLRSRGHADLARDDDRRRRQNAAASSRRFQDGGETKALPAIWSDKADLDARYAKLSQDATAALATDDQGSGELRRGDAGHYQELRRPPRKISRKRELTVGAAGASAALEDTRAKGTQSRAAIVSAAIIIQASLTARTKAAFSTNG